MNHPRLTGKYSTNNFSSSTKGIGGHCHGQVFYRNKSFLGNAYIMATLSLVFIYTFIFLDKYAHEGYSAYEFSFGEIPDIIQSMKYKLWYPVYYYDSEENYPRHNNHWIYGSDSNSINLYLRSS